VLSTLLFAGEGSALSNFDAFHLFAMCIYLFLFLPFIAPNMLLISLSMHPVCLSLRTGLAGRLRSFFFIILGVVLC